MTADLATGRASAVELEGAVFQTGSTIGSGKTGTAANLAAWLVALGILEPGHAPRKIVRRKGRAPIYSHACREPQYGDIKIQRT